LDIANHPQSELVLMLASLLGKITASNDTLHNGPNAIMPPRSGTPLLAFHARNIPSISIQAYLARILKYCPMSSDIFLSLLVYFDRIIHGADAHPFSVDSFNVHRLVITGIVVASKFCSDVFYTNSRYAKVGGLPLSELNHLEFQFLLMNDFRLMIPLEELQRYGDQLLHFW
ncbi:cyclin PHO80-like protein, partial [Protomyces lactucae-debilis]